MVRLMRILLFLLMLGFVSMPARAEEPSPDTVKRGAYIATMGDCTSCHTTPEHGFFAGGLPLNSPMGAIFSSNITPDPNFGIGKYTLAQFIRLMREGVAADGRHIYPAMPYASFATMSDDDLSALYAYLMHGVQPVPYKIPKTKLPWPFSMRWGMALWDAVFARHERYKPDPTRDAQWNRGAYIVQGAGHCGACHTPRGPAYEERGYDQSSPSYLRGAIADNWATANLNGDLASGLGRWSESDIAEFLKTGHGADAVAFGNMKEVVEKSTQYLTDDDRLAIAHYLKSFSRSGEDSRFIPAASDQQVRMQAEVAGEHEMPAAGLFQSACSGCHGSSGEGQLPRFPALAGNPVILEDDPTSLIRILLEGAREPDTEGGPKPAAMPSFANLTDREIAELVSYIRTSWGNQAAPVSDRQVLEERKTLMNAMAKIAKEPNGSAVEK